MEVGGREVERLGILLVSPLVLQVAGQCMHVYMHMYVLLGGPLVLQVAGQCMHVYMHMYVLLGGPLVLQVAGQVVGVDGESLPKVMVV